MKIKAQLGLAACLAFGAPALALASPSAYSSKCGAIAINNDTPATLMRDTEDCSLIWVLPPTAGLTQFTGFTPNANLGLCKEVKGAQASSARIMNRIEETSKGLDDLEPEYKAATKRVVDAKAMVRDLLQKAELKQLADMQLQLEGLEANIETVTGKIDSCKSNCDALDAEYKALAQQRMKLNADIRKLRTQYLASVRAYDKAKADLEAATEELDGVGRGISEIMTRQSKLHKELLDLLLFYSHTEAGYAHIDYDTLWDSSVAKLTAAYGSQYQFRKVATKDARVFANLVGAANESTYLSSMPALLDYSINGMKYVPWGEERVTELSALPSHLVGTIRMSLMGGCPLYYKNFLESDSLKPADVPQIYNFAISATYKFPAAYKMKMTASYNLYKFYEKIVESSSSGGLFSSHTATSISENKVETDMFNIDWTVEDPDSKYDETARQEIAKALKLDLIGRVLGNMAQPVFGAVPQISAPVAGPGEHGAVVLANGLQNTCGMANIWCTAGAWVLRGLDSIFGSDSASSTYRSKFDGTATETWSSLNTKWNTGATVFTSKI